MKNTVKKDLNAGYGNEDKYYSELMDIYNLLDGEEDLEKCKFIHRIGFEFGIDDYEVLLEVIMFSEIYTLDPHESIRCMDEGFVIFSDEMDEIMKFVNEEKINIEDAIEMVKRKRK